MITTLHRRRNRLFVISFLFCIGLFGTSSRLIERETSVTLPQELPQESSTVHKQTSSKKAIAAGLRSVVLDNGLTVLVQPDRSEPTVSISVAYGVGSADEKDDERGIAHLLEHMLFRGTKNRPVQFGRLFKAVGSISNALTVEDTTVYHHLVANDKDKINAILTLEADRMLNTQITAEDLAIEKKVTAAEIAKNDNDSIELLHKELNQAAYPNTGYGHHTLGTLASIEDITEAQVNAFYKKYYTPSNATLIVVGDLDADDTLNKIQTAFGSLTNTETAAPRPAGWVEPADAIPMSAQAEPLVIQRPGAPPRIQANFPLPNYTHPDVPALTILHFMLAYEENYRLDTELIDNRKVADGVYLLPAYRRQPSWYAIQVDSKPEQSPEAVYEALQQSLTQLMEQLEQPIDPAVLLRAQEAYKEEIAYEVQTIDSRADELTEIQIIAGNPHALDNRIAATEAVTAEDVRRVARKYLNPESAAVGFLEPTPDTPNQSPVEIEPIERFETTELVQKAVTPSALIDKKSLENIEKYLPLKTDNTATVRQAVPEKIVLENGLQVLLLPDEDAESVTMRGWVDAGDRFDPEGKVGTALLTARSLSNGSEEPEQDISFHTTTDLDGASLSAELEPENLTAGIKMLASNLQNPDLSDSYFEDKQQQLSDRVANVLTSTVTVAHLALQQALYPKGHPAHQVKTTQSVDALQPADIQTFHSRHYRPESTIVALVGKFDSIQVKPQLTQLFGDWEVAGKTPNLSLPAISTPQGSLYLERTIPKQMDDDIFGAHITMSHSTISRNDPRYYALRVANKILGENVLSSRLSESLRSQQGLTYSQINSRLETGKDHGEFEISINIPEVENVDSAISSAIAVIKQAQTEGITAGELQLAKQSIINSYTQDMLDSGNVADRALEAAANQLDEDELQTYPDKIKAVTLQEVQAAIETLIKPDEMTVVTTIAND